MNFMVKKMNIPKRETQDIVDPAEIAALIRKTTRSGAVLDAVGALLSYCRSLESLVAKLDHRAGVKIMEQGGDTNAIAAQ
jgi:hypothetical protein